MLEYEYRLIQTHSGGPCLYGRPGSTDETVIREIWQENVYRMEPGDCDGVVVDLGANIGAFSVYAALHGGQRVIAVEPEPENCEVLRSNIEQLDLSQRIEVLQAAVCPFNGETRILPHAGGTQVSAAGTVAVMAIELRSVFDGAGIRHCDTLKMDIEGSEYPVIASAPRDILQRIRYLTMEFHDTDAATFGDLVAKLTETHCVQTLGSYERGGYIYARRY